MAATFRTPGRRPAGQAETMNLGSPSLIPRAHHHGTPGTPTGTSTSEVNSTISGTTDSRKRQSKKDEVLTHQSLS
jgi:hypothetical protein